MIQVVFVDEQKLDTIIRTTMAMINRNLPPVASRMMAKFYFKNDKFLDNNHTIRLSLSSTQFSQVFMKNDLISFLIETCKWYKNHMDELERYEDLLSLYEYIEDFVPNRYGELPDLNDDIDSDEEPDEIVENVDTDIREQFMNIIHSLAVIAKKQKYTKESLQLSITEVIDAVYDKENDNE